MARYFSTVPVYSFKNLYTDMSRYAYMSPESTRDLITSMFFIILNKIKEGYRVQIPYFGDFYTKESRELNIIDAEYRIPLHIPKRKVPKFHPYPFSRWYLEPELFNNYRFRSKGLKTYKSRVKKLSSSLYYHTELLRAQAPEGSLD